MGRLVEGMFDLLLDSLVYHHVKRMWFHNPNEVTIEYKDGSEVYLRNKDGHWSFTTRFLPDLEE